MIFPVFHKELSRRSGAHPANEGGEAFFFHGDATSKLVLLNSRVSGISGWRHERVLIMSSRCYSATNLGFDEGE